MWDLRWILLGMGVALIAGIYLWNRKPFIISFWSSSDESERTEPSSSELTADDSRDAEAKARDPSSTVSRLVYAGADKIVTLRFMGRGQENLSCEKTVNALRNAGLVHGKYGIFHYLPGDESDIPLFSVANLTEPGSFDLTNVEDAVISGMSFFIVLPGPGDPVVCFDAMVQTARAISQELGGELFDERGSSWSIQRERYIREEIIEYRHQLTRT